MHMHNFYQQSSCMCAGLVGISLTADWGEPVDISNQRDIEAAERYIQFYLGWFATPLFHGDYPQVMKDYIGMSNQNQNQTMQPCKPCNHLNATI